jgi:hypothetical protein
LTSRPLPSHCSTHGLWELKSSFILFGPRLFSC